MDSCSALSALCSALGTLFGTVCTLFAIVLCSALFNCTQTPDGTGPPQEKMLYLPETEVRVVVDSLVHMDKGARKTRQKSTPVFNAGAPVVLHRSLFEYKISRPSAALACVLWPFLQNSNGSIPGNCIFVDCTRQTT